MKDCNHLAKQAHLASLHHGVFFGASDPAPTVTHLCGSPNGSHLVVLFPKGLTLLRHPNHAHHGGSIPIALSQLFSPLICLPDFLTSMFLALCLEEALNTVKTRKGQSFPNKNNDLDNVLGADLG